MNVHAVEFNIVRSNCLLWIWVEQSQMTFEMLKFKMLFIVCLWPHLPFLDININLKSREKLSIYISVRKQPCSKEVPVLIFWPKGSKRKMEGVSENQHEPEKSIEDGLMKQKTAGMLLPFGLVQNER